MLNILLVDDEPQVEDLVNLVFRRQIKARQFSFIFASNGAEGLEELQRNSSIQILITDINMPRMNGYELIGHVKRDFPDLPIIVVSAYSDLLNKEKAQRLGAYFFAKTTNFGELEKVLHQIIPRDGNDLQPG